MNRLYASPGTKPKQQNGHKCTRTPTPTSPELWLIPKSRWGLKIMNQHHQRTPNHMIYATRPSRISTYRQIRNPNLKNPEIKIICSLIQWTDWIEHITRINLVTHNWKTKTTNTLIYPFDSLLIKNRGEKMCFSIFLFFYFSKNQK